MKNKYLFLFHTTLGAIRLKKTLSARQVYYRVIDAPRTLTAQCGVAVECSLEQTDDFTSLISEQVSAVYQYHDDKPTLKWRDES